MAIHKGVTHGTSFAIGWLGAVTASVWGCGGNVDHGGATGGRDGDGGATVAASNGGNHNATSSNTGGTRAIVSTAYAGPIETDKLDLLLMIDNSLAMGDKQVVLANALPQLLTRLTNPDCISDDGTPANTNPPLPTDACPDGFRREFAPVQDIHIGVVTSSLGDFGGDVCPETPAESTTAGFPDQNDHGWLLGALPRIQGATGVTSDFLAWTKTYSDAYASAITNKTEQFRDFVNATGEIGCGFEMQLESWYRFLVDPTPPMDVSQKEYGGFVVRGKVDQTILRLRKSFLRSDSLVAVVMLTDENDCSLKDSDAFSWVPATSSNNFRMWRASSACALDPNDECCFSCMAVGVDATIPQKCLDADPSCRQDTSAKLSYQDDPTGLRCLHMKQRFGFDFLFPITRYANALTKTVICPEQTYGDLDCACTAAKTKGVECEPGEPVTNPLYDNLDPSVKPTGTDRADPRAVFFAGIVGVPWQDLAEGATLADGTTLNYKRASQLDWNLFAPVDDVTPPTDPLMIESTTPRKGTHPITGEALAQPNTTRDANRINGHEWNPTAGDLQFACIFSLEQPLTGSSTNGTHVCIQEDFCANASEPAKCARQFVGCPCRSAIDPASYAENSPLCQQSDGAYTSTQTRAKANPSIRELQAIRAFYEQSGNNDNAIVASVCPKDLTYTNRNTRGYGYNPAVSALVKQLVLRLKQ